MTVDVTIPPLSEFAPAIVVATVVGVVLGCVHLRKHYGEGFTEVFATAFYFVSSLKFLGAAAVLSAVSYPFCGHPPLTRVGPLGWQDAHMVLTGMTTIFFLLRALIVCVEREWE